MMEIRKMWFVLRKEDEATVATTHNQEFAEIIMKSLSFECVVRVVEYR